MSQPKSWQARISEATDALAQSFVESISYDRRLYKHDIKGSIAHATMLAGAGLISETERDQIIDGLKGIESDIEAGHFAFDITLEDIHMVVEAALIERIGDAGRKLHTARSRNDQVATDLLLWLREARDNLAGPEGLLANLCRAFVDLAERSIDVVMPSYTHLQRAQPISAAAEALAWAEMFDRDWHRLCRTQHDEYANRLPLGSGAIAGSSLPIDPAHSAKLLGFAHPPASSIDHTAGRDEGIEFLFSLSMIAMHLSRWAEQWIIYSSSEFSYIKTADRYTTGSSMMPQKRNPDMLELIRGRCGNIYGNLVAMLTICKGLPIGYNRDLQEDKRHIFAAYDMVCASVTMASAIVASSKYQPENIDLERGFLDATSLAEYLVTRQVPFRTAHHIVGSLVARCEKEGKQALTQLPIEAFREAAKAVGQDPARVGDDVFDALEAENVVRRYRSIGSAGGQPIRQKLAEWKAAFENKA